MNGMLTAKMEMVETNNMSSICTESPSPSECEMLTRKFARLRKLQLMAKQVLAFLIPLVLCVVVPIMVLEPMLSPVLQQLAEIAKLGGFQMVMFIMITSVTALVVPVLTVCALISTLFPFWQALLVATVSRHIAACMGWSVGNLFLRQHFEKLVRRWSVISTINVAVQHEPWKMTLLTRFVMMPEQAKNLSLGAMCVKFKTFFWMTLLGDLQGTTFAVLIGSLSHETTDGGHHDVLSKVAMLFSVSMMFVATLYAKRVHSRFANVSHSSTLDHNVLHFPGEELSVKYHATRVRRRSFNTISSTQPQEFVKTRRPSILMNLV